MHRTPCRHILCATSARNRLRFRANKYASTANYGPVYCEVEAESVEKYRAGGYHPVHLGDRLGRNKYTILHKLGWGGYATVWLARDEQAKRPVAMKILTAEKSYHSNEASILRQVAVQGRNHNVVQLLDTFEEQGPNGKHTCIVTELIGPAVPSITECREDQRLPGRLAWTVVRQLVHGLTHIHQCGITHGDLHPGNVVLTDDTVATLSEVDIFKRLGKPVKGDVHGPAGLCVPRYLVSPSSIRLKIKDDMKIKLIDFGSSFRSPGKAPEMRCALPFRPPESLFTTRWNAAADLWSLGCTIFALIVGHPPFDSITTDKADLIGEWRASFGDLPAEWQRHPLAKASEPAEIETPDISDWLRECYLDTEEKPFFTEAELSAIGEIVRQLLRYRPNERLQLDELMERPMFHEDDPTIWPRWSK